MTSKTDKTAVEVAKRAASLRKILAEDFNIHSDEELIRESEKAMRELDRIVFLLAGESALTDWRRRRRIRLSK